MEIVDRETPAPDVSVAVPPGVAETETETGTVASGSAWTTVGSKRTRTLQNAAGIVTNGPVSVVVPLRQSPDAPVSSVYCGLFIVTVIGPVVCEPVLVMRYVRMPDC